MRAPRARLLRRERAGIPTWSITGGRVSTKYFTLVRFATTTEECFARMHGRTCSSLICARWQIERTQSPPKASVSESARSISVYIWQRFVNWHIKTYLSLFSHILLLSFFFLVCRAASVSIESYSGCKRDVRIVFPSIYNN